MEPAKHGKRPGVPRGFLDIFSVGELLCSDLFVVGFFLYTTLLASWTKISLITDPSYIFIKPRLELQNDIGPLLGGLTDTPGAHEEKVLSGVP